MSVPYTIRGALDTLTSKTSVSPSAPVDLLAVVVSIISPSSATSTSKAKLWIADESISSQVSVCVILYGSTEVSRVTEEQISIGDVIRFNNLSLHKATDHDDNDFQLVYSTIDPEPGLRWFCFGSLLAGDRCIKHDQSVDQKRIPDNMLTAPQRIQDLKTWFCNSRNKIFLSTLSPIPCKKRLLSETQASLGLLSNLGVNVLHHECQQTKILETPPSNSKKRKFASSISHASIGFATVTDSSGVKMSLIDLNNRFSDTLREAKDTGRVLLLTNISSTKQSDIQCIQGKNCAFDEVILVPTRATVALLLSNEESQSSQNLVSYSLPNDATQTQLPGFNSDNQESTLVSSILDISINGKLLHETKCMDSPTSFLKGMIRDGSYVEVTLHLESFAEGGNHLVFAKPSILQTLCGGLEAKELITEERLRLHVFKLVQALIREQVLLIWTIKRNSKEAVVLKVVLPKI